MYLSFMDGNSSGLETPSFNKNVQIFLYYHNKNDIINLLNEIRFNIIKSWELDYKELDGTFTKDIILIAKKTL